MELFQIWPPNKTVQPSGHGPRPLWLVKLGGACCDWSVLHQVIGILGGSSRPTRRGRGALKRERTNTGIHWWLSNTPMHCCHMALSKPGPRFTTIEGRESDLQGEDFLGKEWMMCTGEGAGRYFDNFTFKVLEMGFEQCRYLNLGGAWEPGQGGDASVKKHQ